MEDTAPRMEKTMVSNEKALSLSQESDGDSDSVFTFAEALFPYDRHPTSWAQELTGYSLEKGANQEPEHTPVPLTGWRKIVDGMVLVIAFSLPWIISTTISWMPLTRIRLGEAPKEILVGMISSTVELASLIFMPLIAVYCFPQLSIPRTPGSMTTIAKIWVWFLLVDPPATGIYIWSQSNDLSCESDSDSPQCRVGAGVIRGIGGFRVFGVIGTMFITMAISDTVTKRMQKSQQRDAKVV